MTSEDTTTENKLPSRDVLRAAILGQPHKPRSERIMFFGVEIELRQPPLADVLAAQKAEDRQEAMVGMLIMQAYVPGTDLKVFEDADVDTLKALPFGGDFTRVNEALVKLSDVDFMGGETGSAKTQLST